MQFGPRLNVEPSLDNLVTSEILFPMSAHSRCVEDFGPALPNSGLVSLAPLLESPMSIQMPNRPLAIFPDNDMPLVSHIQVLPMNILLYSPTRLHWIAWRRQITSSESLMLQETFVVLPKGWPITESKKPCCVQNSIAFMLQKQSSN